MSEWVTLDDLDQGSLFETDNGILAVKSEYRYPNWQWECVLLSSGEYAHFPEGNQTRVRVIYLDDIRAELKAARAEIERLRAEAQERG